MGRRRLEVGLGLAWALLGCQATYALTTEERVEILWDRMDQQVLTEKWEDAYATARRAIAIAPRSADAWALYAYGKWLPGDYATAAAACRKALALNPESYRARHVQGLVLWDGGQLTAAAAEFRHALRVNPGHARTHAMLAAMGPADQAVAELETANRLQPNCVEFMQLLAYALGTAGRTEEGLRQNERALALAKTNLEKALIHNNAAYLYLSLGEGSRAMAEAKVAHALVPRKSDYADTLGAVAALHGDPHEAELSLRHALELGSTYAGTHTALAYSLTRQGRTAAARAELAVASPLLVREDADADTLYFAGLAYDQLGERHITRRIFTRAVERWPSHPWAEGMRAWLAEH